MIETKSNVTVKVLTTREEKQFKEIEFDVTKKTLDYVGKYLKFKDSAIFEITQVRTYVSSIDFELKNNTSYTFNIFNQKHFKFFEEIPTELEKKTVVLEMPLELAENVNNVLAEAGYYSDTFEVYEALKKAIASENNS